MTEQWDGVALKARRSELGITARDLADRLGVKFNTVSRWENGQRTPDAATRANIAEAIAELEKMRPNPRLLSPAEAAAIGRIVLAGAEAVLCAANPKATKAALLTAIAGITPDDVTLLERFAGVA